MSFGEIRNGQIGVWLVSLFYFAAITTLVGLVVHDSSNTWLSLSLYFIIYLSSLLWDYRLKVTRDPKQLAFRDALWLYLIFPILMGVAFIIFLPRDINSLIHAPSPKLKNFNDYW